MDKSEEKLNNYVVISKIPGPVNRFRRSASVRVRGERVNSLSFSDSKFPSIIEREEYSFKGSPNRMRLSLSLNRSRSQASVLNGHLEDDLDSLDSFVSNASAISTKSSCEHAQFAKNGTTYSGRLQRYIVHCHTAANESEEYLTPTQRANKKIKRLKSLLQLAREKLREKEEEIFKLTKEVVELKVFKASLSSQYSDKDSPSEQKDISSEKEENSVINCDAGVQALSTPEDIKKLKDYPCDTYNDLSPMKNSFYFEDNNEELLKMSPVSPQHCFGEKLSATPDFLLSSLADSGNFDDIASSVSLHSKDSIGFTITPDFRLAHCDKHLDEPDNFVLKNDGGEEEEEGDDDDDEKLKILNIYEKKLKEQKSEYEMELKRIVDDQEEKNIKMMRDFEDKLKEEEIKFEERWMKLLKASEEEKQGIVERFERKLAEEKEKYMDILLNSQKRKASESFSGEAYIRTVEEEKSIYESSLQRIKSKFEIEKSLIENSFDEAMKQERKNFEERITLMKETNDNKIKELLDTIADLENRQKDLMCKYEETVNKNGELELENKKLKEALDDQEERHKNVYLKLYMKGQEAAKLEHEHQLAEIAERAPNRVTIPELLVQLKVTESELENLKDKGYNASNGEGVCLLSSKQAISLWMLAFRKAMYKRLAEAQASAVQAKSKNDGQAEATLQFLKSAVFYFLTDRENHLGHLRAIENILGFSAEEKSSIEKHYPW